MVVSGAPRSIMSTGAPGLLASYTRIVPLVPTVGGVSNTIRSGASVHTPVAPLAGNVEVTCSSGVVRGASDASVSTTTSTPPSAPASSGCEAFPPPQPTANEIRTNDGRRICPMSRRAPARRLRTPRLLEVRDRDREARDRPRRRTALDHALRRRAVDRRNRSLQQRLRFLRLLAADRRAQPLDDGPHGRLLGRVARRPRDALPVRLL